MILYIVIPLTAAVITSTVLYALDYNTVNSELIYSAGCYSSINIGDKLIARKDNITTDKSSSISETVDTENREKMQENQSDWERAIQGKAVAQVNQTLNTQTYQVVQMKSSEDVFIEKILTSKDTYDLIEKQLDCCVESDYLGSEPIYFQDAVIKRYVDSQNKIISLIGFIDATGKVKVVNLKDSGDYGFGEIHQNLEGNLRVIYKDEYTNNIIKLIVLMCCVDDQSENEQQLNSESTKYTYYADINKYFTQLGASSCESLRDTLNVSKDSEICVNSVRFGKQTVETDKMDRIFIQMKVDSRLFNLLVKLDADYMIFDTDLI